MRLYLIIAFIVLLVDFAGSESLKIDTKVDEELQLNEKIPVIIILKEQDNVKFRIKSKDVQTEVLSKLNQDEIKFKDKFSIVNGFSAVVNKQGLEKLKNDQNVLRIEYNFPVESLLQDSIPLINASLVHNLIADNNITGRNEAICIIDTGVNETSALTNKLLSEQCYQTDNAAFSSVLCPDTNAEQEGIGSAADDNGHGTHVAGIAAANNTIIGVAPEANIVAIKALNSSGDGFSGDVIRGIEFCTANATLYNISIISMSLGGGSFSSYCDSSQTAYRDAINAAIAKNISVIAATGNSGSSTNIAAPACIENTTAVAWSAKNDAVATSSNRNSITDLIAPGSNINSTYFDGTFQILSGTSMATPHVAGAFALLRQYKLEENGTILLPNEIETMLNNTGRGIYDSSSAITFSRIDLIEAIIKFDSRAPDVFNESKDQDVIYNYTNITFFVNINDTNIDTVWIEGNWTGDLTNFTVTEKDNDLYNYTLDSDNFTINDFIVWRFYANDSNGNINFTDQNNFTVAGINVTLQYPENNTYFNLQALTFNFTAVDTINDIFNCSLFLNNELNISNEATLNNTLTEFTVNLNESQHEFYIECVNGTNTAASETRIFTIDNTNPKISLEYPNDNLAITAANMTFNFTVVDANINTCDLYGNWSNWHLNQTITATNNVINEFSFLILANETYIWNVNCVDLANNNAFNSTNLTFMFNYLLIEDSGNSNPGSSGSSGGGGGGGGGSKATPPITSEVVKTITTLLIEEASYELTDINLNEVKENKELKLALGNLLNKELTEEFIDSIIKDSYEIINSTIVNRRLFSDENNSVLTLKVSYSGNDVNNFLIYDKLPKEFAENADEIEIKTNTNYSIVEADPSFIFSFDEFKNEQTETITYSVKKPVNLTINNFEKPLILTAKIEEKIKVEEPIKTKQFPMKLIIIISIVIIVLIVLKSLKKEYTKSKKRKIR